MKDYFESTKLPDKMRKYALNVDFIQRNLKFALKIRFMKL